MKYIKICEGSVRVKIERGENVHLKHFYIRSYPSLEKAMEAAIQWRDDTHISIYGIPVMDKVVQVTQRQQLISHLDPSTGKKLPELTTGLSYGFHRDRLLYVVASYQENNKPKRRRFSISKLGVEAAMVEAARFRVAVVKKES